MLSIQKTILLKNRMRNKNLEQPHMRNMSSGMGETNDGEFKVYT